MLMPLIQNTIHTPLANLCTICSCSQLGVDLWRCIPVHQYKLSFADMESLSHTYVYVVPGPSLSYGLKATVSV